MLYEPTLTKVFLMAYSNTQWIEHIIRYLRTCWSVDFNCCGLPNFSNGPCNSYTCPRHIVILVLKYVFKWDLTCHIIHSSLDPMPGPRLWHLHMHLPGATQVPQTPRNLKFKPQASPSWLWAIMESIGLIIILLFWRVLNRIIQDQSANP